MVTDEDFLFGKPVEEVDEPLDTAPSVDINLEVKKLEEKDKDRKEKRYFSAFKLIVGCLVFLGIIYIIDTIVTIAFGKTSDATNSIIEIIKTLLFTLSGYLFARKENGD
ncbi:hypothetical protein AALD22_26790 [Lachnospiraceae bacterium 56-18]|jgi:hypothetical protein|uniref:hypothetical protein n=1 Tax=Sporofaciens sp. JLR.KK001 TaxID=3112621 RepID=UPI0021743487|nr:hypothetical protein [Dorea sp.]